MIQSIPKTPADVTATGTWIRNSLIASTNPHTSIRAEPQTPLSAKLGMMIYERAPQSSAFIMKPEQFEPIIEDVDRNGRRALPSKHRKSQVVSSSNVSQMFALKSHDSYQSNVDILEEFKGPLINKNGELYDDKSYDQTYKKRLRLREVHRI